MTSSDTHGNPHRATQNLNFPFSIPASELLQRIPADLITSHEVLDQFLEDPRGRLRTDWFAYQAWLQVAVVLDNDVGVSKDQYDSVENSFNQILEELIRWASARPDMPEGYADQMPAGTLNEGNRACQHIFMLTRSLNTLQNDAPIESMTRMALKNFSDALWEYYECIAFEIEASFDQIAVTDVRDRFERGTKMPWTPAVTPENVEHGGIFAGGGDLPGDPPGGDPPGDPPGGGLPGGDLPGGDLPGGDLPGGDLPGGDLPGGEESGDF